MNRVIKFRAWDIQNERFINPEFCAIYGDGQYMVEDNGDYIEATSNEITVEQFTGLTDKNGKEIYEGDLIKLKWSSGDEKMETIAEVKYSVKYGGSFYLDDQKRADFFFNSNDFDKVVIGNIHEQLKEQTTASVQSVRRWVC